MGTPMFASAPTSEGQWYSVMVRQNGTIAGVIPGVYATKAAADENAKREVGPLK